MTRHSLIGTGCVLVAIAASGCSSHSSYPLTWPAIPETATRTCEQVAGTYRDQGQLYGTAYSPQSLTKVLLRQNGRTAPADVRPVAAWRAESVSLSFPRVDQIEIGVSGPEGQSSSTTFAAEEGRFVCQTGSVMLRRPALWQGGAVPGLARFSEMMELFSVEDYLVVKQKKQSFMLIGFILPFVDRQTDWFRFERATRVPEGKDRIDSRNQLAPRAAQ
jgi:hypothetical protein